MLKMLSWLIIQAKLLLNCFTCSRWKVNLIFSLQLSYIPSILSLLHMYLFACLFLTAGDQIEWGSWCSPAVHRVHALWYSAQQYRPVLGSNDVVFLRLIGAGGQLDHTWQHSGWLPLAPPALWQSLLAVLWRPCAVGHCLSFLSIMHLLRPLSNLATPIRKGFILKQ